LEPLLRPAPQARQGPGQHRRPAPVVWLDDRHRHLIAPLALWDIAEQLEAVAELFRLRARP
jgi:hypothetical protein